MALSTFVGSFTVPLATGNQAQTGVGFQPIALILWGNGRSADGASASAVTNTDCPTYYGMAVSSSSRVVVGAGDIFSAGSGSFEDTTKCLKLIANGVTKFAADFVSFDADGFTVNFTTGFATADVVNYLALGGADLTNVFIKSFTAKTSTGNQAYTGVGFKPDALLILCQSTPTAGDGAIGIGFGVSATKRGANCYLAQASSPFGETTYQRTTKVTTAITNSAVLREADVVTLDADGFTLNWTTASAAAPNLYALCLKGGQYNAGSFLQKTSTGSQATTGIGFQPTGLLASHVGAAAATTVSTIGVFKGLGAASGSANRAATWYGNFNDGVAELNRAVVYTSRADDGTPTLQGKADLTSFDADGWTLNYGTADATAREILYFALGNAAAAPSNWGPSLLSAGWNRIVQP